MAGEEISIEARIISIADAYDVMINGRPYQEAITEEEAVQRIKKEAGQQFDPELATVFVKLKDEGRI